MPNFEPFSRHLLAPGAGPLVTLRKHGVIALNTAAFRALHEPVAVALDFDRERGVVSVAQVDHRDGQARFVRSANRAGAPPYLISATSFLRTHGIVAPVSSRWDAVVANGCLYATLDASALTTDAEPALQQAVGHAESAYDVVVL